MSTCLWILLLIGWAFLMWLLWSVYQQKYGQRVIVPPPSENDIDF